MDTQKVVFVNKELNTRLAGLLRLPDCFDLSLDYPAVVVTGPMLSLKEQVQSVYAEKLTEKGFVTLVFDGTYFGESEGTPRGRGKSGQRGLRKGRGRAHVLELHAQSL